MTNFGDKLKSSTKRLGVKMDRGRKKLGHKIYDDMGKHQSSFRAVDNTLGEVAQLAAFVPGGKAIALAAVGAHVANSVAKKSKKNQLEKYNSRKAKEDRDDRATRDRSIKPGFF